ncbi:MAG: ATP-binding cassette domain-containing protein, partial [Elusimicrobiota bacterium]
VMLNKRLDSRAANLSGGEKQRLSLGRIILQDPEVFLLDEPSSSLDEKTEDAVMSNVTEYIKKRKKTAIIVSHSRNIAEKFSGDIKEIKGDGIEQRLKV